MQKLFNNIRIVFLLFFLSINTPKNYYLKNKKRKRLKRKGFTNIVSPASLINQFNINNKVNKNKNELELKANTENNENELKNKNIFTKYIEKISAGNNIINNSIDTIKKEDDFTNELPNIFINNYKLEVDDDFFSIEDNFYYFIENEIDSIFTLLIIRMFFEYQNIDYNSIKKNQKEEINYIKITNKIFQSQFYPTTSYLTKNNKIFKNIIYIIISDMLHNEAHSKKVSLWEKIFNFFPTNKKIFIENITKKILRNFANLSKINSNFSIDSFELILYLLAYNLEKNKSWLTDCINPSPFLKYIFYLSQESSSKDILEKERMLDSVINNSNSLENNEEEIFSENTTNHNLAKFYIKIIRNLFQD